WHSKAWRRLGVCWRARWRRALALPRRWGSVGWGVWREARGSNGGFQQSARGSGRSTASWGSCRSWRLECSRLPRCRRRRRVRRQFQAMQSLAGIELFLIWLLWIYPFLFRAPKWQKRESLTVFGSTTAGLILQMAGFFIVWFFQSP